MGIYCRQRWRWGRNSGFSWTHSLLNRMVWRSEIRKEMLLCFVWKWVPLWGLRTSRIKQGISRTGVCSYPHIPLWAGCYVHDLLKGTGKQGQFLFLGKAHLLFITIIKTFLMWDICHLVFRSPSWLGLKHGIYQLDPCFGISRKLLICVYYLSFESEHCDYRAYFLSFILFFPPNNRVAAGQAFCFLGVFLQLTFKPKPLLQGNPQGYSKQIWCR